MMVGQTDTNGKYSVGSFFGFSDHGDHSTSGSGGLGGDIELDTGYAGYFIPASFIKSLSLTTNQEWIWEFANGVNIKSSAGSESWYGIVDAGFFARNALNWKRADFDWSEPIKILPNKYSYEDSQNHPLDLDVNAGSLHAVLKDAKLFDKNGSYNTYSFEEAGLHVDSEPERLWGKSIAMEPRSGNCTVTASNQTIVGKIDTNLVAIAGWLEDEGNTRYAVLPLDKIDRATSISISNSLKPSVQEGHQYLNKSELAPIWFTVEDKNGQKRTIKNLKGAFAGLVYEAPPRGYYWTIPNPIITGGISCSGVAIDWKGASVHIAFGSIQEIDFQQKTVSFTDTILGQKTHNFLNFSDAVNSQSFGADIDNALLRGQDKWATMAISGVQEDGGFVVFPIQNMRRITLASSNAIPTQSPALVATKIQSEAKDILKIKTKDGEIEIKNPDISLDAACSFDSNARSDASCSRLFDDWKESCYLPHKIFCVAIKMFRDIQSVLEYRYGFILVCGKLPKLHVR